MRVFESAPIEELRELAGRAKETVVAAGTIIAHEGEIGRELYLIASGAVLVFARAFEASQVTLEQLNAGDHFGENAALPGDAMTRFASASAIEECRLLVVTRDDLEALGETSAVVRRLRQTSAERALLRYEKIRGDVLHALGVGGDYRVEHYRPDDRVLSEGDRVHVVLAGTARVARAENCSDGDVSSILMPGQFFGELATAGRAVRSESVYAETELEVASIDGARFREALRENRQLKLIVDSQSGVYLLPSRGLVVIQTSQLRGEPTLVATHSLPDGRRVMSTRLINRGAFVARELHAPEADQLLLHVSRDPERPLRCELHLVRRRIAEIVCEGEWRELGDALMMLLDGAELNDEAQRQFAEAGQFAACPAGRGAGLDALVCQCNGLSRRQIAQAIENGCTTLERLAALTGATGVCGGCRPIVEEMLGCAEWTEVQLTDVTALSDGIRRFLLRPAASPGRPHLAGQHVVLQARIDGEWVSRSYTIASAPRAEGSFEIVVKREANGLFSRWLFDERRPELELRVSPPRGTFCVAPGQDADVVCFAGGIGITPALAMVRTHAASAWPFRLHVDHSVSDDGELVCRDELLALASSHPRITLRFRVTRREGRLARPDVASVVREHPDASFFLCGRPAFMDDVCSWLIAAGIASERIRIERFSLGI
jgi:ferredoxin-NADP reductase/CRP-like cAMP-binding protein